MVKLAEIVAYLYNCPVSIPSGCAAGTGLIGIHKRVFNHSTNMAKADLVKDLSEFYVNKQNIVDLFNSLNECERDFITYFIQYGCREYLQTTLEYAEKHNIELEYTSSNGYTRKVLDDYAYCSLKFLHLLNRHIPGTKVSVLFPNGREIPFFILETLKSIIEPITCEYRTYTPLKSDYVICRENRLGDFAAIVRFAGTEQLKVKDNPFDLTKAKLAKMAETIGFEEVCDQEGYFCTLKAAKRIKDFKVAPLLFTLAVNSKLVDITSEGDVLPGKQSTDLLMLPHHELAKKLFNDYAHENKICELHYIAHISAYDREKWIQWHECRKTILLLLKACPTDIFINFADFDKYAKIFCGDFFKRLLSYTVTVWGYNYGYDHFSGYGPNWDEREAQIIRTIFSFLSAIGMIDIAYTQKTPRTPHSYDGFCVGISGFRITKLGAWLLGITDTYEAPTTLIPRNDEGELLVLPDYSIIITGLKCRIKHEIYLSRFLTKVSTDENASVYKLDFKSIIRAYNTKITPTKIIKYLKAASNKTLPDNVERSLTDWQTKVGRIKIHKLTVLETDDALLLEEIKHIKAMDNIIISDLRHAISLVDDSEKKAKALIEKNGWLVDI